MTRTAWMILGVALLAACASTAPVVDVLAPSDTSDTVGPYEVAVTIRDEGWIKRAELFWYVEAGAAQPVALVRDGETERWTARIPGQPTGATVRLRVEVEDDEGQIVVMPEATAEDPSPAYQFRVGPAAGG